MVAEVVGKNVSASASVEDDEFHVYIIYFVVVRLRECLK